MKRFQVKSLMVIVLALAMVISLVACGKPDETTAPSDLTDPVETDPVVVEPTETNPPEDIDPEVTGPAQTDPVEVTEPEETDPKYDPIVTDPVVTEPIETTPEETTKAPEETTKAPEETVAPSAGGAHDHLYVRQIIASPGCVSDGEEAMVCSHCGDAIDHKVIGAIGHSSAVVEAHITSLTHHTAKVEQCQSCGVVIRFVEYIEGHNFELVKRESYDDEDVTAGGYTPFGYEIFACEDEVGGKPCGYTVYVGANATDGHYYVADEGSGKMHCMYCENAAPADVVYVDNPNAGPQLFAAE